MRNLIFLLFIFFAIPNLSIAQVEVNRPIVQNEQTCPSIDLRENFGPIRNQGDLGFCWAHAGVDLVGEHLCKNDPSTCGKLLSVTDAARCSWGDEYLVGKDKLVAGNTIPSSIECGLKKGICLEENLPYSLTSAMIKQMTNCEDVICMTKVVRDAYNKREQAYQEQFSELLCYGERSSIQRLLGFFKVIKTDLSIWYYEEMPLTYSNRYDSYIGREEVVREVFSKYEQMLDYLNRPECANFRRGQDRNLKTKYKLFEMTTTYENKTEKLNYIRSVLGKETSVAVAYCTDQYEIQEGIIINPTEPERCGAHGVIINGMKMTDGKCMINIRNSWGPASHTNGWIEAENFLPHISEIHHINKLR